MENLDYRDVLEPKKVKSIIRQAKRMGFRKDQMPDLVQDIALEILKFRYDKTNPSKASKSTVIHSIIHHHLCNARRAEVYEKEKVNETTIFVCETCDSKHELVVDVRMAIEALGPVERQICELMLEGLSNQDIAKKLRWSWHRVERAVGRVRMHFKQLSLGEWIGVDHE